MGRLIDADALMDRAFKLKTVNGINVYVIDASAVENAPTVDAVQVGRCGECKNWEENPLTNGNGTRFGTCPLMMGLFFKSDFYCADGKRKNNETKLKGE